MPDDTKFPDWWIYRGTGQPNRAVFPESPPWRSFTGQVPDGEPDTVPSGTGAALDAIGSRRLGRYRQAIAYQADEEEINCVNLALHLRRPLLVTGQPGVGKSTLAYSVAFELELGPVLRWSITSRSTLLDGQYQYDAIGRLQEVSLRREAAAGKPHEDNAPRTLPDIGSYVRLGPLGTALLPRRHPRVLLIDEIDKSDVDLPNDLLNIFEDGEFIIPELARLEQDQVTVTTADPGGSAALKDGTVRCAEFPFVVLTSNGERSFSKAFLRRCIQLEIRPPSEAKLARMVAAHLEPEGPPDASVREQLIAEFIRRQTQEAAVLANDQLLNALLMATVGLWDNDSGRTLIEDHLLRPLDEA
jgi:MoxR-like ATPase